tara:strand:- start:1327 stop:1860 length:534 start_codon:yes stop_codon:yes gene_type:complete
MQVVKIEDISDLQIYCEKCRDLGWINNSSLERLNIDMMTENQGAYFGIYENNEIVSIAGIYKFHELYPDDWRMFYRTATLPGKAKNKGLHRGTGLRGRLYINEFLKYTNNGNLYLTTNIKNGDWENITRYHRALEKESSQKDSYVHYHDKVNLYEREQVIWKLDNEQYYQRTQKHHL